jgi:galactose mutarotase-like enzyme
LGKDPAHWDETAPILFPIVGWTRSGARAAGKSFPLGLHGFARAMNFSVKALEPARVRLALASSPETLALYPFPFRLCVDYSLTEDSFTTSLTVANRGEGPMPYACGLHPGFAGPTTRAATPRSCFQRRKILACPKFRRRGCFSRAGAPFR